jgi:hypothetical protein
MAAMLHLDSLPRAWKRTAIGYIQPTFAGVEVQST